jgi:hypothetical protein
LTEVHLPLCHLSKDLKKVECIIIQNFSPEGMTLDVMVYYILMTLIKFQVPKERMCRKILKVAIKALNRHDIDWIQELL